MNSNNFFEDLAKIVKETAGDCKTYRNICNKSNYDFDTSLSESKLGDIPYIPWSLFKQSNNKFKDLLRGNTFNKLDFWMESSSTCGDPSIIGRLDHDIEVLKTNYNDVFNSSEIVSISADAAITEGNIVKVEFYANNSKIGETDTAPFVCRWANVNAGVYELQA